MPGSAPALSQPEFEPEKYEDRYRQAVLEAVDRKVAGEEVVVAPTEEPREQIIDLVAALKQSLSEKASAPEKTKARKVRRKKSAGCKAS